MRTDEQRARDRAYQAARRAAGLAWDQRPENAERVATRKERYNRSVAGYIRNVIYEIKRKRHRAEATAVRLGMEHLIPDRRDRS